MTVDASVVVPTFRGAGRLPQLLESLVGQRLLPGSTWELLVVVDGVVDDSPDVLREWGDQLPLIVVTLPENRGRSAALNAGFAAATGRVLIRCDDDLSPTAEFVALHVAHHDGPPVGAVGLCPNVETETRYDRVYGRAAGRRSISYGYSLAADDRWRLWAANCSVSRDTYELVGPYDESFREYGWEDIDWGYRLHKAGIPIDVAEDLEAVHRGVPVTARERISRAFASGRARGAFERKHNLGPLDTALPDPSPRASQRTWNALVSAGSRIDGADGWNRVGAAIDGVLPLVPARVGGKLVALGVEGAGSAGDARAQRRPTQ